MSMKNGDEKITMDRQPVGVRLNDGHPGNAGERSLARMDAIVVYYRNQSGVLALLAFGSLAEKERFDGYSDLDFLVVCLPEHKSELLDSVSGLAAVSPVAYSRIDGEDAVRLLFDDGVLCDYGIVTPEQYAAFEHVGGRVLWKQSGLADAFLPEEPGTRIPGNLPVRRETSVQDWTGDVLLHVYVGILRERRGESAAAFEEIQVIAAGGLLRGLEAGTVGGDAYSPRRRAEKAASRGLLSRIMPGYAHNLSAAKAILDEIKKETCPALLLGQVRKLLVDESADFK